VQQLREAQRWLGAIVLEPGRLDDDAFAAEIADVLVCSSPEAVTARLRAYTGGYPARIGEALAEMYPALKHVVGVSAFAALVARYVPHVPDGIYNLSDVGVSLAEFLAGDTLTRDFPFASDLARLEHAVHAAFHARERPPLDPASLADWTMEDWSSAVLDFQPSVTLVSSAWPVRDVWDARDTPVEDIDIALEGRPQQVLVHRSGYDVVCEALDVEEADALEQMQEGARLGEAIERIAERGGDPEAVTRWFARWTARGLITGVRKETGAPQ